MILHIDDGERYLDLVVPNDTALIIVNKIICNKISAVSSQTKGYLKYLCDNGYIDFDKLWHSNEETIKNNLRKTIYNEKKGWINFEENLKRGVKS